MRLVEFCVQLRICKMRGESMENYTDLAFRYIKMKRSRSILTVLGVGISVMLL